MATTAQCLFCFEVLAAHLEKRKHLSLQQCETLYARYRADFRGESVPDGDSELGESALAEEADVTGTDDDDDDDDDIAAHADVAAHSTSLGDSIPSANLRLPQPEAVSRLQSSTPSSGSSSSDSPSSASSSTTVLSKASQTSSRSSLFSFRKVAVPTEPEYPVFVTWNEITSRGHKQLRGCIGTFEAGPLPKQLENYAITASMHDHRFSPISPREVPSLSCSLTLLVNFTECETPLSWDLGTHGIRIKFRYQGTRYGGTYLPDVAPEQGWDKEATLNSLVKKAGVSLRRGADWRSMTDLVVTRYQGMQASVDWKQFNEWRQWTRSEGLA